MSSEESHYSQSAAYQLGKLDAQLHAEREARARTERSNAYLLDILAERRTSPVCRDCPSSTAVRDKPDAELAQRIEELRLELKLERLKAHARDESSRIEDFRKTHVGPPNSRAVRISSAERTGALRDLAAPEQEEVDANRHDSSRDADVPRAEWMLPAAKDTPINIPTRVGKTQFKSYFAPSVARAHNTLPSEGYTASSMAGARIAANYAQVPGYEDGTTRFGRFERDCPRAPRSLGRPPPNPRPSYPGDLPPQPWLMRGLSQLPSRPPTASTRLVSYADLDRPVEPPLPLHDQPSSGFLDFSEALYDEPPRLSKTNDEKTVAEPPITSSSPPSVHWIKRGVNARSPFWPVFTAPLLSHRHVDITKLRSLDTIPAFLKHVSAHHFLLSASQPAKTVRVVSPSEVETTYALTLEFARGDGAAELIRSFKDLLTKAEAAAAVSGERAARRGEEEATQRSDRPSPPIRRELGEAVWLHGASKTLLVEKAGPALRVPANLKYQVESCPYEVRRPVTTTDATSPFGNGREGYCGGRLQVPPEHLRDGSIKLVFWDVRDAIVAFKAWSKNPVFQEAMVSYGNEGAALPEVEEEAVAEESTEAKPSAEGIAQKANAEGNKDGDAEASALSLKRPATHSSISSIELDREEDEGYAAGSSESMENSIVLSPEVISLKEEKEEESGSPRKHSRDSVPSQRSRHASMYPGQHPRTHPSSNGSDVGVSLVAPSADERDAPMATSNSVLALKYHDSAF